MNLIELLFFLSAVLLSFFLGRYFFKYAGWWGTLPASILGFSIVIGIIAALSKLFSKRPHQKMQQQLSERKNDE